MSLTRRLFFALWPDERTRAAIVERARALDDLGGRPVPVHNLHLTLLFLGDVPGDRFDGLAAGASGIRTGAFDLRLDRFGSFRAARVAWIGGDPAPAGAVLVDRLGAVAESAGLTVDDRPWRPHVTLRRRIEGGGRALSLKAPPAPVDWPIRAFSLIESVPARPYQVLRTWPVE